MVAIVVNNCGKGKGVPQQAQRVPEGLDSQMSCYIYH